jgi:multidrug resistance efflux pump
VIVALAGLIPVRLSALAPAEITPLSPIPITSPLDGVVREIVVKPNQIVKADEVLVLLDDTALRSRLELASRSLDIARADLQRATFKSFTDEASRFELQVLNARVQEKVAELAFLGELLAKSKLTAPQGGVAIFSSPEDWRGRPVQVGERVMVIADPSLIDVTIYLPPTTRSSWKRGAGEPAAARRSAVAARGEDRARELRGDARARRHARLRDRAQLAPGRACRASACAAPRRSTPGA